MSFHNGYNLGQMDGGEYTMSMAYLAAWKGPVLEVEDPYGDGHSPDNLKAAVHVQEMQIIGSKDYNAIKEAVFYTEEFKVHCICPLTMQEVKNHSIIIRRAAHTAISEWKT